MRVSNLKLKDQYIVGITCLAELVESAFGLIDGLDPVLGLGVTTLQRVLEW